MKRVAIKTKYIKLCQFLKFSGMVQTGGQAKQLIESGNVIVNDVTCLLRGQKLRNGDIVKCGSIIFEVFF